MLCCAGLFILSLWLWWLVLVESPPLPPRPPLQVDPRPASSRCPYSGRRAQYIKNLINGVINPKPWRFTYRERIPLNTHRAEIYCPAGWEVDWIDGWMKEYLDGWWVGDPMNKWMNGRINGRTDEWMDRLTYWLLERFKIGGREEWRGQGEGQGQCGMKEWLVANMSIRQPEGETWRWRDKEGCAWRRIPWLFDWLIDSLID